MEGCQSVQATEARFSPTQSLRRVSSDPTSHSPSLASNAGSLSKSEGGTPWKLAEAARPPAPTLAHRLWDKRVHLPVQKGAPRVVVLRARSQLTQARLLFSNFLVLLSQRLSEGNYKSTVKRWKDTSFDSLPAY